MVADTAEPFFAPDPVELDISFGSPELQSRVTVAFRILLVLPHLVVLFVLGFIAVLLAIVGWFAALVLGRLPRWIAVFEMRVIAYSVRVNAYMFLLAGKFPAFPFEPADYPVSVKIDASRLSRVRVLFRLLLAIPVGIVAAIAGNGLLLFSPIIWLFTLVLGRTPQPLFSAAAGVIRYQARYYAYLGLVTDVYPRRLFGDADSEWATEGFRVSRSGATEWITGMIVVLGLAGVIANGVLRYELTRPPPENQAVVVAELRLENAVVNAVAVVGCNLRCEKAHERAAGEAYDRFASRISRIPFPVSKLGGVAAVVRDARQAGRLLLAASKSKDGGRAQGIDPSDPGDSLWFDDFDTEIANVLGVEGIFH